MKLFIQKMVKPLLILLSCLLLFTACNEAVTQSPVSQGAQGEKGEKGDKGDKGEQGQQGEQGVSIQKVECKNGEWVVTYSDGRVETVQVLSEEANSELSHLMFFELIDGTYGVMGNDLESCFEVTIPSTYQDKSVTQILPNAFKDAINLTALTVEDGVKNIGANAFAGCVRLTSVILPSNLEKVDLYAFDACSNISIVEIPAVAASAVCRVSDTVVLKDVSIIGGNSLDLWAVCNTENLYISNSITKIRTDTVSSTKIKTVSIDKNNSQYCVIENCIVDITTKSLIFCSRRTIPNDPRIENIASFAVIQGYYSTLTAPLEISKNIKSIQANAFYYSGCFTIKYEGIKNEWEVINKATDWQDRTSYTIDGYSYNYIIYIKCSDGDVTVNSY